MIAFVKMQSFLLNRLDLLLFTIHSPALAHFYLLLFTSDSNQTNFNFPSTIIRKSNIFSCYFGCCWNSPQTSKRFHWTKGIKYSSETKIIFCEHWRTFQFTFYLSIRKTLGFTSNYSSTWKYTFNCKTKFHFSFIKVYSFYFSIRIKKNKVEMFGKMKEK